MKSCSLILAAGGSGTRFGGEVNKILLPLHGKAVVQHSLEVFLLHPAIRQIVIACREEDQAALEEIVRQAEDLCRDKKETPLPPVALTKGGATRQESVYRALLLCTEEFVLIHDAARPFVKAEMADACLAALDHADGAAVAVKSRDTVKICDEDGYVLSTTDRSRTWLVQTPQAARREALLSAYEKAESLPATDDASLLEAAGYRVRLVPGSSGNRKITTPEDLPRG